MGSLEDALWEVFKGNFEQMTPQGIEPDKGLKGSFALEVEEVIGDHGFMDEDEAREFSRDNIEPVGNEGWD